MTSAFPKLLRLQQVKDLVGMSTSSIYRWMEEGRFPRPINIGANSVRWRESDLVEWLESRTQEAVGVGD